MAQAISIKADPMRYVLADLIAESQAPITLDRLLREFRATSDKRLPDAQLLLMLESICNKRPNYQEVLTEIEAILARKDPMYALLIFVTRFGGDDNLKQIRNGPPYNTNSDMPQPSIRSLQAQSLLDALSCYSSASSLQDEQSNGSSSGRQSQDISTSTPVTSRVTEDGNSPESGNVPNSASSRNNVNNGATAILGDLSMIKQRVLHAVTNSILNQPQSFDALRPIPNTSRSTNSIPISPSIEKSASGAAPAATGLDSDGQSGTANLPECKMVNKHRPLDFRTHMFWDYCKSDSQNLVQKLEVAALPLKNQQQVLLQELIYCLSGVRGNYIEPIPETPTSTHIKFNLNMNFDKSLIEVAQEILPLASNFHGIQKIIATINGRGQVNDALNAALHNISHDFYLLLTQVEGELLKDELTMPKLLYYLQPTIWIMEGIWNALADLQTHDYRGAAVLTHLCSRIKRLGGDKTTQNLIISLTTQAAQPYMRMLQLWIQKGVISDSTQEFLVVDNEVKHKDKLLEHYSDDYWERRYTLRHESIPKFLDKYADKILRTGKYLNVIRQCGKRVLPVQQMDLIFDPTTERHEFVINDAYYFAARMLLDVLLTENDLMGHLQSVKRYLLLNQGDFMMQFMDACEDELSKNVDQVLPMALENLLGLTLRLSSARSDPYKDDLHCELLTYDLVTQMSKIMNSTEEYWKTTDRLDLSGLECFAFTYEVKWPVSLVLNHIAITKYQMLFRQLFYCKHVDRQLCKIWKENSIAKKFSPFAAELYRSAFTLRQRMMNAIQNLEYYMMIEIIEPNWHIFIEKMKSVENVDMVLKLHQDFLDLCLKNCMLTETSNVNRAIFKLCKICLHFCDFIQRSQRFFLDAELKSMVCDSSDEHTDHSDSEPDTSDRPQVESSLDQSDTFAERVKRFDLEFTGMLISFLKQVNDLAMDNTSDRFMNLVHRINFNGFYSDQMEKLCAVNAMG